MLSLRKRRTAKLEKITDMSAQYSSKHGLVSKSPEELFMSFVDMRNFTQMAPAEYKDKMKADYDTLRFSIQSFEIGIRVVERTPYSLIVIKDDGAPFGFSVSIHFDRTADSSKTDFYIEAEADLNLVMKAMLGGKIREALDKVVDSLVMISNGRMPADITKDFNL